MPKVKQRSADDHERLPVFVYGTLRPGQKNHDPFLAGRTLAECPASVRGRLYFVDGEGYPYILPGEGRVAGNLAYLAEGFYEATLESLDRLEDYDPQNETGSLYLRRRTLVLLPDGRRVKAWVYYWNSEEKQGRRIESGDFLRR